MKKTVLIGLVALLVGCGQTVQPKKVPNLRGERLDFAEERLEARGLEWEEIGGGTFGVIVRSHWYVRDQIPAPGKNAATVRLFVERDDDDWDD